TEQDVAVVRRAHPGEHAHERRLPRAVRTDDAEHLARRDARVDGAERLASGVANADAARLEHERARERDRAHRSAPASSLAWRRNNKRKNGPPQSAVTTPTGSSVEPSTLRAAVSATTRNAPPIHIA